MYQKYWAFPDDTGASYDALWRTHLGWLACAEYARAAARGSGLDVSPETMERWFRFGGYAYLLDQLIDEQPATQRDEAYRLYECLIRGEHLGAGRVPEWFNPDLLSAAALFNAAVDQPSPEAQRLALQFPVCARSKAAEGNAWCYAAEVAHEGRLLGQLLAECMTDKGSQSKQYRRFKRWIGDFAAGGALFDATRDLGHDYAEGRTSVRPTRANRLILAGWCLWTSAKLMFCPRIFGATFMVFPRFWGIPLRLRASDGKPAVAWKASAREAWASQTAQSRAGLGPWKP